MTIPHLPTPGDLLYLFLRLALGPGAILSLIVLILAARSWYQSIRTAFETTKAIAGVAGPTFARLRRMRAAALALAAASTVIMLAAQGIWLLVNYVIGNLLSGLIGTNHALHSLPGDYIPAWAQFIHSLELDPVSEGYVIVSAIALAASYVSAIRGSSAAAIGHMFAVPGYIYGFCGLVGGALTLILYLFHVKAGFVTTAWITLMFGAGVVACLYVLSCILVFGAPALVSELWSGTGSSYAVGRFRS